MTETQAREIIHVAKLSSGRGEQIHLLLRKVGPHEFEWFTRNREGHEIATDILAPSAQEAIRLARSEWKLNGFRTLGCGFRYTLPERDEHGMNALFCEMVASESTSNGIYFDEERGYNCFVQAASKEALEFWKQIKDSE